MKEEDHDARLPYRTILTLGIAALALTAMPGGASAHTPAASRSQSAPTFVFPSNGQSFPLNGTMLFQVQPMSGAKGYLWSFVQDGAIMYQNLAWAGRLDGATYTISKGSAAQHQLHSGPMQVWVRALMGNDTWSGSSSVSVQLQGSGGAGPNPQPTTKAGPPAAGTVIYQANWSNGRDGWTLPQSWDTVGGELVNDGTMGDQSKQAHPPAIHPSTANYAVEAEIQMVRTTHNACYSNQDSFGVAVREDSNGYYAVGMGGGDWAGGWKAIISDLSRGDNCTYVYNTNLANSSINVDTSWHTYRVEVRGNDIRFSLDGNSVVETTDNHHLKGNVVGLWSNGVVLNVRSFKVIAL